MTKRILLILLYQKDRKGMLSIITQEFDSVDTCERAIKIIKANTSNILSPNQNLNIFSMEK